MFIFGVALGIIASFSFLAIMMKAMPPNPPDDIITGQNWFITGLGVVEITKVLKGHIAVATTDLKKINTGKKVDIRARQFLKKDGLDYAHGTGHGVEDHMDTASIGDID